jgi:phosphatidylglycerol lysyltransferase
VSPPSALEVQALVARHGREGSVFQILERGFEWFVVRDLGCVGYVDTGRCWVAAGAPIGPPGRTQELVQGFLQAAEARGRRACFFGVEEQPAHELGLRGLMLAKQPEWDPLLDAERKPKASLREQHRRARAKGVSARAVRRSELLPEGDLNRRIDALARRWLAHRRMEALGFVVHVNQELWRPEALGSRLFVAERGKELVGVAVLLPAGKGQGWYLKHLLRDPAAPNGTSELLFHAVLLTLAGEGCRYLTWGLAPLAGEVPWALRLARRALRPAFDFEGLLRFKAKLSPSAWTPIYLSYPAAGSAPRALLDSLHAFAPQGRVRFALASMRKSLVKNAAGRRSSPGELSPAPPPPGDPTCKDRSRVEPIAARGLSL